MATWHVPEAVTQRDPGDTCQMSNCWAAVGVWLLDAATGGENRPEINDFKKKVGTTAGGVNPNTNCPKGLEVDLLAGLEAFGVEQISRPTLSREDAEELLGTARRRVFSIAVDYGAWPAAKDCSPAEMGDSVNHMVGLIPGLDGKMIQVMNPMCLDKAGKPRYQKVALDAVLDAAQQFSVEHGRDGIQLLGVRRPIPDGMTGETATIEELREQVEEQRQALLRARHIIARALGD